jgi:hypothetical protein
VGSEVAGHTGRNEHDTRVAQHIEVTAVARVDATIHNVDGA